MASLQWRALAQIFAPGAKVVPSSVLRDREREMWAHACLPLPLAPAR